MFLLRKIHTSLFFLFSGLISVSQNIGPDDPIASLLDSLANQKIFEKAFTKPVFPKGNKYNYTPDSVPRFDDYTFQARLAKLDVNSPFDLIYNEHVKGFINLYTVRKRESVSRMMGVAQLYYPMFEEVFDRYNIPLELKHLAVIESALIPYAKSRAGAMGLWQFMYPTGKMYGLNVSSYLDDRCDPYKATVAAAEYLKALYGMFNDWQMVLAAYNAGPGNISKAIRRSGGKKTYWEIRPFLPLETQGYVPAFIAANYVMNYATEHNIYPAIPRKTYFEVDTVIVKEQMSFDQLSQALDISIEELQYFNPQYRKNVIPSGGNALCLQKPKIGLFITNEQEIYAAVQAQQSMMSSMPLSYKEVKKTHVVKSGEKLAGIAKKYGVTVMDIKSWNYIGKKGIRPGKTLVIYVPQKEESQAKLAIKTDKEGERKISDSTSVKTERLVAQKNNNTQYTLHKVKKGESIYLISKKYGTTTDAVMETNNLKSKDLKIGQVLKIKNN